MAEKLVVTQIKSGIRAPWRQQRTLEALGLRHHQMTVVHNDSPAIRGMLFKVRHLVKVTEEAGS